MFLCVKNADVYSPGHLGKRDILICNDRIIAIEPQMEALPQGCRVLDAAGRRVIPGLIDAAHGGSPSAPRGQMDDLP